MDGIGLGVDVLQLLPFLLEISPANLLVREAVKFTAKPIGSSLRQTQSLGSTEKCGSLTLNCGLVRVAAVPHAGAYRGAVNPVLALLLVLLGTHLGEVLTPV